MIKDKCIGTIKEISQEESRQIIGGGPGPNYVAGLSPAVKSDAAGHAVADFFYGVYVGFFD